ncbi:hypothetical protein CAPTEDRAFT_197946 [Capitella teleta]|uniref:Endonuclease/exonuclease/phosphatase domain-containing protein n=1 Tax=Capitella teleta TaxID=283909 RepID=R7U614_CAPTE|nr:hypothetical protein CAPTEDRAFT_197946 [Capitella teleta]|eukprot:ELU01526.1 hypothetical protein CAPTEDRAFT_197946 [Capitella teleta]
MCPNVPSSQVDFTYVNSATGAKFVLDHFIVSHNVFNGVSRYVVLHDGDNLSDHHPVQLELCIDVEYSTCCKAQPSPRPAWHRAGELHLQRYREHLQNELLMRVEILTEALACRTFNCSDHLDDLKVYYAAFMKALASSANACIPAWKKKAMAGWSEHVADWKEKAIFWHSMWLSGGQVHGGWLHAIMLETRAEYKRVSRWVVRNQEKLVAGCMADTLCENRSRDLWSEIKQEKDSNCRQSNVINGAVGSHDSCQVFNETYKSLYQSVPSSESELNILYEELKAGIRDKCQSGAC